MIKLLRPFALLAALLASLVAPAAYAEPQGQPANEAAKPAPAPQQAQPALWKVSDKDTTIWLFGTIHVLPPGVEWFNGKIAKAFGCSQELVTEIVEPDPATMRAVLLEKAILPQGQNLRGLLSEKDKAEYEATLSRLGLPVTALDNFEPWYAAVTLSILPLMQDGFAREQGAEFTLEQHAKARNLHHIGLETPEYQFNVFDQLPPDAQRRYLDEVVEGMPTMKDDLNAMVEAWKHGDADTLARLMNAQEDDPALIEALLTNRNHNWAQWIRDRLTKPGTVFVAVGAGHLAGSGSVQEQLRAIGISSERVQ